MKETSSPKLPVEVGELKTSMVEVIARSESCAALVKFKGNKGPDVKHVVRVLNERVIGSPDEEVLKDDPVADGRKQRVALLESMSPRRIKQVRIPTEASISRGIAVVIEFSPRQFSKGIIA